MSLGSEYLCMQKELEPINLTGQGLGGSSSSNKNKNKSDGTGDEIEMKRLNEDSDDNV
ncbi:hypothetical protein HDU92_002928 [Lobulomyces angularis]|nr:hypothetical protein HDU92_002928 [Lobulomyces angularis]